MRLAHCVSLVWLGLVSGFNGNSLANSHPKDLTEDSGSLEALRKVYEIDEIKDLGILTQLPQRNLEKVSSDQPELAIGQIVELKLPKEGKLLSTITHLFEADENLHVEMQVQEDPMSNIHLVLNSRDHRLSGSLFVGGNSYFVHHEGRKTFLLEQNDLEYEGPNPTIPRVAELMKTGLHPLNAITTTTSDKFVDVMILYTDDVAANSNAEETLRSRVDSVNSMLAESCANFRYRLVYIGSISYVETGNTSTDLSQLTNSSDGQIDSVHTLRDTYGADLVQLVTSTGSACGLAYLSQKDYYNEAYGFSVTNYWCNAKTMAHEWGHNLGSEHDRYERGVQKNQETLSLTGYGFVDLLNKYLDIMAYPDQCNDAGVSCTAINRFSNPRIFHNGVAFGIENYSNSVQRMDEAFPYIANFRTAVSSYEPDIKPSCVGKSDNKDLHCFIATAAYGSYLQPHVKILREFRDQVLKTHSLGRSFVRVYYEYSPSLARWIEASPLMAKMVRFLIYLLVLGIQYWMVLSIGLLILFISILALRASVKAWVSGFLIICFVVGRIQNVEAQVSTSSRIYSDRVTNP
ncbi:MAG: hypothetical protein KDD35_05620, partial [Bdellovibrionales bacterium]|nr:hypothetical protein [Bdellovibrionales bacterium]